MDDRLASGGPRTGYDDNDSTITERDAPEQSVKRKKPNPLPDLTSLTAEAAAEILGKIPIEYWYQSMFTLNAAFRDRIAKLVCKNIRGLCIGHDHVQIMFHEDPPFCQGTFRKELLFFGSNSPHRILEDCVPGGFCRTEIQKATSDFPSQCTLKISRETQHLCVYLIKNAGQWFELLHFGHTRNDDTHKNFIIELCVAVTAHSTHLKSLLLDQCIFKIREDEVIQIFTDALPSLANLEEFVALNGLDEDQMHNNVGLCARHVVKSILVSIVKPIRKLLLENVWIDDDVVRHMTGMTLQSLCFRTTYYDPLVIPKLLHPSLMSSCQILADLRLSFPLLTDACFPEGLSVFSEFLNLRLFNLGYQHATEKCVNAGPIANALSTGFSNLKSLQLESINYGQLVNAEFSPNGHFLDNVSEHLVSLSFVLRGDEYDGGFMGNCDDLRLAISKNLKMSALKTLVISCDSMYPNCHLADFVADHCPMLSLLFCFDMVGTKEWTPQLNALHDRLHICNDDINRPKKTAPSGNFAPSLAVQHCRSNTSESPTQLATSNRCGKVFRQSTHSDNTYIVDIDRICRKTTN